MTLVTTYSEPRQHTFRFALRLTDYLTRSSTLAGPVGVKILNYPQGKYARTEPSHAANGSVFVITEIPNGLYDLAITSPPEAPYYRDNLLTIAVPFGNPRWPAFPDISLADPTLPLSDPAQPFIYRLQYLASLMLPSTAYPFSGTATLARGTVFAGTVPLGGATVENLGSTDLPYVTNDNGEYAVVFENPPMSTQTVTLRASHPGKPDVDVFVDIRREMTVTADIVMAP